MSRKRVYHADRLLDGAMRAFWEHGYRATSLQQLVSATGVNRYSLYDAYADKHGLFLACLDRYQLVVVTSWLEPLERPGASLPELHAFFTASMASLLDGDGPRGCLTCNTAFEIGSATPEIAERIESYVARMTGAFERALTVGKEQGALSADTDARVKADYLMGVLIGLFGFARTSASRVALERYMGEALRDLG